MYLVLLKYYIGVAPGGAGGTLAPPPLKVGGPGPPTFGAGKKINILDTIK